MTGYRYELNFCGEWQGVGIFQGLDELHLDHIEERTLLSMFDELPVPPQVIFSIYNTISYFTEKGLKHFEKSITQIQKAYIEYSDFTCELYEETIDKNTIIYEDEYQVITKKGDNYA